MNISSEASDRPRTVGVASVSVNGSENFFISPVSPVIGQYVYNVVPIRSKYIARGGDFESTYSGSYSVLVYRTLNAASNVTSLILVRVSGRSVLDTEYDVTLPSAEALNASVSIFKSPDETVAYTASALYTSA